MVRRYHAGWPKAHIAKAMRVSRKCVHTRISRFETEGHWGLVDRSSRPHSMPTRTPRAFEAQILTWRDVDEMFKLAQFVGCTRPGTEGLELPLDQLPMDRITLLEVPALAISSTECRARVAKGNPTWYLVPDGIVQYIAKRELYTNR